MLRRRLLQCGATVFASIVIGTLASAEPTAKDDSGTGPASAAPAGKAVSEPADDDDDGQPKKRAGTNAKLTPKQTTATHKQVRKILPAHDGRPVALATFCLAGNGNLLACVADNQQADETPANETSDANQKSQSFVQEYSPEGKLLKEIPVPFNATAINVSPGGDVFIAGEGKMARIVDGKVIGESPTPHIGDYETFKKQVLEAAKEEMAEYRKQFDDEIKTLTKQIKGLEAKSKKQELTKREQAQLEAAKQQLDEQNQQIEAIVAGMGDPDEQVRERLVVTALGVTERDVFISVMSVKGHGYEAWRTNHEFQEPKKVVDSLSGCCGQMDLQARGDRLFVAENGKFEVSVRDRDGKRLSAFGKRDRTAVDGFGSCCNPMNIRCCENGDILAAESSIGNIKRFNARGEFVGLVGKAKIGVGCKHVALAFDESRDRYYMMNVDKGHIAMLIPVGEVPPETEAEKAANAARAEFSRRLIGRWVRAGLQPKKVAGNSLTGLINSVLGNGGREGAMPQEPFDSVVFSENGNLKADGGLLGMYLSSNSPSWEAVALDGKVLDVAFNMDGAEFTGAKIELISDDEIEVRAQMFGSGDFGQAYRFTREKTADKRNADKAKPGKRR